MVCDLAIDQLQETLAHRGRRNEQFLVISLVGVTGEKMKQVNDVGRDSRIASKQAQVGIELGRPHVVVPSSDVRVAAQLILVLSYH